MCPSFFHEGREKNRYSNPYPIIGANNADIIISEATAYDNIEAANKHDMAQNI